MKKKVFLFKIRIVHWAYFLLFQSKFARRIQFFWLKFINRIKYHNYKNSEILYLHAFGLGDMIFAATVYENFSENFKRVYVPCQKKYLKNLSSLFGYLENIEFVPVSADIDEQRAVLDVIEFYKLPFIKCARRAFSVTQDLFPSHGLNSIDAAASGIKNLNLTSSKLANHLDLLIASSEVTYLDEPYAFIDHIKGSPREIPSYLLGEIQQRGLHLIFNNPDIPIVQIYQSMKMARELHLMGSSLLCLAIVTSIQTDKNCYYKPGNAWDLRDDDASGFWRTNTLS